MKRYGLVIACLGAMTASAQAGSAPQRADFHLISRADDGVFMGSHKIFKREADGLKKVSYCGKSYWVSAKTVAWTEVEAKHNRIVRVEYNSGKGWRPICAKPERQVTLADIGINVEAEEVATGNATALNWIHRFDAVRTAFRN